MHLLVVNPEIRRDYHKSELIALLQQASQFKQASPRFVPVVRDSEALLPSADRAYYPVIRPAAIVVLRAVGA